MRKVLYGYGVLEYNDIKNDPFPEKYVTLIKITPPDEIKEKEEFMAEAIKTGRVHPRKRPKAI